MNLAHIFTDIPILIVLSTFVISTLFCLNRYFYINKNLKIFLKFLQNFKKTDLNFRFKEIDEWMTLNSYVSGAWLEFKNTLVFSESVALRGSNNNVTYKEVSTTVQNIQTTVDPLYFFNEETLIMSKYNHKFIGSVPTILTGLGPLFTFLNIAIAFGKVDFASQEKTISSVANLMTSMQVAALVSVFAVGSCLIFTIIERVTYNNVCKKYLLKCQELISQLFDNISSEKFLFELLRETKVQNNNLQHLIAGMPENFKVALNSGIASNLVPYLENLIIGINLMNKQMKESAKNSGGDVVDDIF